MASAITAGSGTAPSEAALMSGGGGGDTTTWRGTGWACSVLDTSSLATGAGGGISLLCDSRSGADGVAGGSTAVGAVRAGSPPALVAGTEGAGMAGCFGCASGSSISSSSEEDGGGGDATASCAALSWLASGPVMHLLHLPVALRGITFETSPKSTSVLRCGSGSGVASGADSTADAGNRDASL